MVKQSPFQQDLFDFKYIEEQVAQIKKSLNNSSFESEDSNEIHIQEEQSINELLNNQLTILQDVQFLLNEIKNNTKKKKGWLNSKEGS